MDNLDLHTIYFYGLISSILLNFIILTVNIHYNDVFSKDEHKNMVYIHYTLSVLSWAGISILLGLFTRMMLEEIKNNKGKRKK